MLGTAFARENINSIRRVANPPPRKSLGAESLFTSTRRSVVAMCHVAVFTPDESWGPPPHPLWLGVGVGGEEEEEEGGGDGAPRLAAAEPRQAPSLPPAAAPAACRVAVVSLLPERSQPFRPNRSDRRGAGRGRGRALRVGKRMQIRTPLYLHGRRTYQRAVCACV